MENQHQLEQLLTTVANQDYEKKVNFWSSHFEGRPYRDNPCGDSLDTEIVQIENPINTERVPSSGCINLREFDCVTYTDTICAAAAANSYEEFLRVYLQLRYAGRDNPVCQPNFQDRHHYIEQWYLWNVEKKGFFSSAGLAPFPPDTIVQLKLLFDNSGSSLPPDRFSLELPVISLELLLEKSEKSGLPSTIFFNQQCYLNSLKSGDVWIFVADNMRHICVMRNNALAPELTCATTLKKSIVAYDLVKYLHMLFLFRSMRYLVLLRPTQKLKNFMLEGNT